MYGNLSNEEMQMQQHGSFESEGAATSRMTEMTASPYNYAWTPKVNPTVVEKEKIVEKIVEVKERFSQQRDPVEQRKQIKFVVGPRGANLPGANLPPKKRVCKTQA